MRWLIIYEKYIANALNQAYKHPQNTSAEPGKGPNKWVIFEGKMTKNTNVFSKVNDLAAEARQSWLSWRIYGYAKCNDTRGVKKCLNAGVDPNFPRPDHGFTPLHIAVVNGYNVMLTHLLAYGADVDQRTTYGNTMLGVALDHGQEEAAALLLAHGADPNKAHVTDYNMLPVLNRLVRLHSKHQLVTDDYSKLSNAVETMFDQVRNLPHKRNFNGTEWGRNKAA